MKASLESVHKRWDCKLSEAGFVRSFASGSVVAGGQDFFVSSRRRFEDLEDCARVPQECSLVDVLECFLVEDYIGRDTKPQQLRTRRL